MRVAVRVAVRVQACSCSCLQLESTGKQLILTSWPTGLLAHSLTHYLPTGRVGREVRDVARERVGGERAWLGFGEG